MQISIKIFILSICLLSNCMRLLSDTNIKEIEISPRIGYEINSENKSYFNFFPNIGDFKSAKLFQLNDSILFFQIEKYFHNSINKDTLKFSIKEFSALQKIIANYEYVVWDESHANNLKINWSPLIIKIIQPRMRYFNEWYEIKFELQDKSIVQGNLLWADSSFIIVGPMFVKYDWKNMTNQYQVYHFSEIERFYSPRSKEFMGRKDIYQLNLEYLQELSAFQEKDGDDTYLISPELNKLLLIKQEVTSKIINENSTNLDAFIISKLPKYCFSIEYLMPSFNPIFFPEIILKGNAKYYDYSPAKLGWYIKQETISVMPLPMMGTNIPGFLFEYKLFDHLNIGTGLNLYQSEFKYSPEKPSGIDLHGVLLVLFLSYTKNLRNAYRFDFFSDFEISYRIGIIYGNFNNSISINSTYGNEIYTNFRDKLKYEHSVYGAMIDIKFSYFITDYFTLDARSYINMITPVNIEKWEHIIDYYHELTIDQESFNYSGVGLRFGFGLRI